MPLTMHHFSLSKGNGFAWPKCPPGTTSSPHFGKKWELLNQQHRERIETPAPLQRDHVDLFDGIRPNNPQHREELIESILEDVETAPTLHARLTTIRDDHPAIQRFSVNYPRTYIRMLSNLAITYQAEGLEAAQAQLNRFIQEPDRYLP